MRYKRLIAVSILVFAFAGAWAQKYDPTVEVTKDFVSKMSDAQKVEVNPPLPDSLSRFNLKFDYEVFDKPYKGSYTFTPYNVMLIPDDNPLKRPFFYLNAGAGYGFHPELTAVISPRLGRKFTLDIYQDLGGYSGAYEGYSGRDISELAGVRGSLRMDSYDLLFDLHYNALSVLDTVLTSGGYHRFGGNVRMSSSDMAANWMSYDVSASYNMAREMAGLSPLSEYEFLLYGTLAPSLQYEKLRFLLGFNTGYRGYSGAMDATLYSIETVPQFRFDLWKLHFNLGAKLSYLSRPSGHAMHLYPDMRLDLRLFKDRLDVFAGLSGGDRLNSYSSLKAENHHFTLANALGGQDDVLSCTRELYNAYLGLGGSVGSVFQYDIRAGHSKIADDTLLGADASGNATLVLGDYSLNYLDATTTVKTVPVEFNMGMHLRSADIDSAKAFSLPLLSSDASLVWNWHRRLFVGAEFEMLSSRSMDTYTLDAFYRLGLSFEMKLCRWMSLWLKGDNLLNQRIERIPGVVETGLGNGLWLSAGIRLDLR